MNAVAQLQETAVQNFDLNTQQYAQLNTFYDERYKTGWFRMSGEPRPCFTPELLSNISSYFAFVRKEMMVTRGQKYDFLVLASDVEGVFNLGGDLDRFASLIMNRDRDSLMKYAMSCIDVLYANMTHLNTELTTLALVKGDALGGGFEAALSSNVLIAERGAKLGLPEVLFNLFPGMGAYSMLARKIGPATAEKMIMSGKLYSAEELYEMGVVDILAEQGEGEMEVYRFISRAKKTANTHRAIRKVKDYCNPISYEELVDITRIWVDAALDLSTRDIKMMQRLVQRQTAKASAA